MWLHSVQEVVRRVLRELSFIGHSQARLRAVLTRERRGRRVDGVPGELDNVVGHILFQINLFCTFFNIIAICHYILGPPPKRPKPGGEIDDGPHGTLNPKQVEKMMMILNVKSC